MMEWLKGIFNVRMGVAKVLESWRGPCIIPLYKCKWEKRNVKITEG